MGSQITAGVALAFGIGLCALGTAATAAGGGAPEVVAQVRVQVPLDEAVVSGGVGGTDRWVLRAANRVCAEAARTHIADRNEFMASCLPATIADARRQLAAARAPAPAQRVARK